MLALSQLLREGLAGPLNGEQQKYVDVIERNGQNLIRLVDDVLDLSRMELDRLDLDLQAVDLGEQLHASVMELAPLAQEKNIDLVANAAGLPPVRCDPARLAQVLTNLIGNAIKFTDRGRVSIEAEVASGSVVVHVCDTGVGIPEAARSRVFDEFFQVGQRESDGRVLSHRGRSSTPRRGAGVGLGLAITKRLVRLMGGALSVESTEGVGSRFTFSLPTAQPHAGWLGAAADPGEGQGDSAINDSESDEDVGSSARRFRDEPHGTNTAG